MPTSKQTHQNFKIYLSELTNIFVQITLYIILRRKTYTALTQSCFSSKTNSSEKKRGCPRQTNPKASTWSPNIFVITKYFFVVAGLVWKRIYLSCHHSQNIIKNIKERQPILFWYKISHCFALKIFAEITLTLETDADKNYSIKFVSSYVLD